MRMCTKIHKPSTPSGISPNLKGTASHSQEVSLDSDAGKSIHFSCTAYLSNKGDTFWRNMFIEFALVVTSQKLVYGSWLLRSSLPLIYLLEKTRMGIPLPQRPNSMLLWQGMSKTYLFRAPVPVSKTKMLVPLVDRNRLNARFPRDSRKQQS